jgi:hypothetical protein
MWRKAFAALLFLLGPSLSDAKAAEKLVFGLPSNVTGPSNGGYEIPVYGDDEKISRIFQAPDEHLLLSFVFKDHGILKSDIFDTKTGKRAYPDKAFRAARDNSVERDYLSALNAKPILPSIGATPNGHEVHSSYEGGRICPNNPYMADFQLGQNWDDKFFLFQKLQRPEHRSLGPDCGVKNVTYRYKDRIATLYANDKGFFAAVDRFLIWFDWGAHSPFLKGRDDFVVVPGSALEQALGERGDGEAYGPATIQRMDSIIAKFGIQQKAENIK